MQMIDSFANRLKSIRAEREWTLVEMEKVTGIAAQTLNRYELGQHVPKIDVIPKLSLSLNVDPMWLQGYDVEKKPIVRNDDELNNLKENNKKKKLAELVLSLDEKQLSQLERLMDAVDMIPDIPKDSSASN